MHIFGCKFSLKTDAGDTVPDRKNFDSLLWAIVTVFQVLCSFYKKTSRNITSIIQHQFNICLCVSLVDPDSGGLERGVV